MTQPTAQPPLIGAAMLTSHLPRFIDWLAADHRDLELQDPAYPGYLYQDWMPDAKAARALLDTSGYQGRVGIHAAFMGIDISTPDVQLRTAMADSLRRSLEFGEVIGATHAVIHSPFMWFGSPQVYFSSPQSRAFIGDGVRAMLDLLLPLAERINCAFVIETIADANTRALVELVRSFDSPFVRLSIDTGHVAIMERMGGAPPSQWVEDAGDLLGHIHLQDTDGHGDRHWGLGDGTINWRAFFKALRASPANPRMILELMDINDVMPSMAWLAQHGLGR